MQKPEPDSKTFRLVSNLPAGEADIKALHAALTQCGPDAGPWSAVPFPGTPGLLYWSSPESFPEEDAVACIRDGVVSLIPVFFGEKVHVGQPVGTQYLSGLAADELGRYLRSRCFALEALDRPSLTPESSLAGAEPLASPSDPARVAGEVAGLGDRLLFETGGYRAYLVRESDAPELMREVYRLREATFRAVGEGTGKALDTDAYDREYRHLVLWHISDAAVAGSYRIGYGPDLMAAHEGVSGFYSSTLVDYGPDAPAILSRSMELGRSFVVGRYQRDVLPLKLLLAGLCVAATRDTSVEYCVGLVSISTVLPDLYKSLAVHFLQRDLRLEDAGRFASPTNPFRPDFLGVDPEDLLQVVPQGDIDAFDRLLSSISEGCYRIPVLFRKYFSCGARVACFNVDPAFSDSLDAMIVLRLRDFPRESIRSFVRSLPQESQDRVFRHFYPDDVA